ncbi:MAG: sigma-70 family RNA polymerase sigma factor [Planctomycetota bacterium]
MDDQEVETALDAATERDGLDAVGPVLESYRGRIERMIRMRMDPRLTGRAGVSDVVQDAYVEIARRLPSYLDERARAPSGTRDGDRDDVETRPDPSAPEESGGPMPFYLWVRFIAAQSLRQLHRRHLGTIARDAGRDVGLQSPVGGLPEASSLLLASALVESGVSPSGAAAADEQRELLRGALEDLAAADREVLFLRHFEQLSNKEVAALLGLSAPGASLRHLRALQRLQAALARVGVAFDPER